MLLARNPLEKTENSRSIVAVFADGVRVAGMVSRSRVGFAREAIVAIGAC